MKIRSSVVTIGWWCCSLLHQYVCYIRRLRTRCSPKHRESKQGAHRRERTAAFARRTPPWRTLFRIFTAKRSTNGGGSISPQASMFWLSNCRASSSFLHRLPVMRAGAPGDSNARKAIKFILSKRLCFKQQSMLGEGVKNAVVRKCLQHNRPASPATGQPSPGTLACQDVVLINGNMSGVGRTTDEESWPSVGSRVGPQLVSMPLPNDTV